MLLGLITLLDSYLDTAYTQFIAEKEPQIKPARRIFGKHLSVFYPHVSTITCRDKINVCCTARYLKGLWYWKIYNNLDLYGAKLNILISKHYTINSSIN